MHTSAILPLQYFHSWIVSHQSILLVLFSHALLQGLDSERGTSSLTAHESFCISRDRLYISIAQFTLKSSLPLYVLVYAVRCLGGAQPLRIGA
jgi:hypothetical protein